MAAYLLAYFGYEQWKNSETPEVSAEKVADDSSNDCEIILDSLRKVNKNLLLVVFILLSIILLLIILRRFFKIRKYRKNRNNRYAKDPISNC